MEQQLVQLKINRMHMLTEALRSFVLWVAWKHDAKIHSANAGLAMNYSSNVIQEVTEIGMDIFGAAGGRMHPGIDKLVRDGMIWIHLAGDIVQRMRVVRRHIVKH
jgi:alkylation response protein AidB-like acyl-CoA dehydrogenase